MREDPTHRASRVHASPEGGGAGKWLLGALAAAIVLGGGYFAWQALAPNQDNPDLAYNEYAEDPLRAAPLEDEDLAAAPAGAGEPATASAPRSPPRAPARAAPAEATIGITPANSAIEEDDEIIVPAPRRPVWASVPNSRRLSAMYPSRQLERGREGEARLNCTVQPSGALDCVQVEETPGFGDAALRVARSLRHAPQFADGSEAIGSPVNLRVVFRINEEAPRQGRFRS